MVMSAQAWAGIDAGKSHHHVVVIDAGGRQLLSRRVANDEAELGGLIDVALLLAPALTWAVDLADGAAALVITLLLGRGQRVLYLPGVAVNRAAAGYRGEGKTDARDAAIIADQARMRRDLRELRTVDEAITELRMLTAHRADLSADRTRAINRLRGRLTEVCPALERALDFTNHGPLILISSYQTCRAINAAAPGEVEQFLRSQRVRGAARLAATAVQAARQQQTRVSGEDMAATLIASLAATVLDPDRQIARTDALIAARFRAHPHAPVITSMTGIGDLLGAEFVAATGGTLAGFTSADHLAGYAGLAPAPRDSGRRTGNLHRPRRYNRGRSRVRQVIEDEFGRSR